MKKLIFVISFVVLFSFLFGFTAPEAKAATAAELQVLIQQIQEKIAAIELKLAQQMATMNCHISPLWFWDYCSPSCQCSAGEGDCDSNNDCTTGYCAMNVGEDYGQVSTMDVCEEKEEKKDFDMLIFISPQYKDDSQIKLAIDSYIAAVKEDINWDTEVIKITIENNDFKKIDNIIEEYYNSSSGRLKACIMVGEDIHTASGGDTAHTESPSIVPWATMGEEAAYEFDTHFHPGAEQITGKEGSLDIAISLIYPTHELDYQTKLLKIVSVFNKFSKNRDIPYSKNIAAFVSTVDRGIISGEPAIRQTYQTLKNCGDLYYVEDPSGEVIVNSLDGSYMMYSVSGHSSPINTMVASTTSFSADYADNLDTPLFTASGCYTGGWNNDYINTGINRDNGFLDFSRDTSWYGSKIFKNPSLRAMVLGIPDNTPYSDFVIDDRNFIVKAVPKLVEGKTLAESVIHQEYENLNGWLIYGDPTFHYVFAEIEPSVTVLSPNGGEKWAIGNTYTIKWSTTWDSSKTVQIGLIDTRYDSEAGPRGEATIAWSTSNTGSYTWTIPKALGIMDLTVTDLPVYKVKIYVDGGGEGKFDDSDAPFSIVSTETTCTDSDGGRDYFVKGKISGLYKGYINNFYDYCENSNVVHEFFCEGSEIKETLHTCSYGCKDGACQVGITVISPDGGEKWETGKTYDISWASEGTNYSTVHVNIYLWKDGAFVKTIALGVSPSTLGGSPSVGKYSWKIPSDLTPGSDYQIRLYASGIAKSDISDNYFSIVSGTDSTCVDTDGGKNYYVEGSGGGWKTDTEWEYFGDGCYLNDNRVASCSGTGCYLAEKYCEGKYVRTENYTCPYGCKDGACLKKCTDSDGGKNYYTKGTVVVEWPGHQTSVADFCSKDTTLYEGYCKDGELRMISYNCPYGCSDGACVER